MAVWDDVTAPFERVTGMFRGTSYEITRWLFLRGLGGVFLVAFLSLGVQLHGLIGPEGILPAGEYLTAVREQFGAARYWLVPTVLWLGSGKLALNLVTGLGVLASIVLLLDLRPRVALACCWILYLSLVAVGQDFLSFQWDSLLLETGLIALFLAPGGRRSERAAAPALGVFLLWFLLFRLLLESGYVKLSSGDSTWRDLTALDYHFYTQPLPTWSAWYGNLLPHWLKAGGVLLTYLCELGVPWLIFIGRWPRRVAFVATVLFQFMIGSTGNYTFFNLLTVVVALSLLDDEVWRRLLPSWLRAIITSARPPDTAPGPGARVGTALGLALLLLAAGTLWDTVFAARLPGVDTALRLLSPFESVNSYGLFRVMTTTRQEIVVEGSDDGSSWREYRFRYKPGEVTSRPGFVEPHQPRLDWQMWFAALATFRSTPWFQALLVRLLQGSPDVLGLLAENPFPDHPPHYVRALLYDYRFSTWDERRATGAWWIRDSAGSYSPVLGFQDSPAP